MILEHLENFVITNKWTHLSHGYARDELVRVQRYLKLHGAENKILSNDSSFGDILALRKFVFLEKIPHNLNRSIIFRTSNNILDKDIRRTWKNYFKVKENSHKSFVVTSGTIRDLIFLVNSSTMLKIFIRLTHLEGLSELSPEILKSICEGIRLQKFHLAIETIDGCDKFFAETGIKTSWVPPAQGIFFAENFYPSAINKRNKIGIFWPITSRPSIKSIMNFLENIEGRNTVVRLPPHTDSTEIKKRFPALEIVSNGLDFEAFEEATSEISRVILPHTSYINRGSGLAYFFLSKGVPLLVDESNSFLKEIYLSNLVTSISYKNLDSSAHVIKRFLHDDHMMNQINTKLFSRGVSDKWKNFLLPNY